MEAYRLGYLERPKQKSQVWWHKPISPALRRLRQRDCHKFKASTAPQRQVGKNYIHSRALSQNSKNKTVP